MVWKLELLNQSETTDLCIAPFLSIFTAYATESFAFPRKMKSYFAFFTLAVAGVAAGDGSYYDNAATHYEGQVER